MKCVTVPDNETTLMVYIMASSFNYFNFTSAHHHNTILQIPISPSHCCNREEASQRRESELL